MALPVIFHFSSLAFYLFLANVHFGLKLPPDLKIGMPSFKENWWQFLTIWNLVFQGTYFGTCVAVHVLNLTPRKVLAKEKETLKFARDVIFQSLVLPCSMAVSTVFWVVFTYDRQMIFPVEIDPLVPSWLNHCLHTTILFFAFGELLICRRPFYNIWSRFVIGTIIMVMYNATLVLSYHWQGFWTYPMFGFMTEIQRIIFYCCMYLTYITTYTLSCIGNRLICGKKNERGHWKTS